MILGFTGSRWGMSDKQKEILAHYICQFLPERVHHGVCAGSDQHFHESVRQHTTAVIEGHPGVNKEGERIYRANVQCDILHPEKYFLVRNKDIVDVSDILLATPDTAQKSNKGVINGSPAATRGGSWNTINYARKMKKHNIVIYTDGTVEEEKY